MVPTLGSHAGCAIVLLGTTNHVGLMGRSNDPIELCGGVVLIGPAFSAIHGDVCAPVIAVDHPVRVRRGDPEIVVVAVGNPKGAIELLPTVVGTVEGGVQDVNPVLVLGVRIDPGIVESPLAKLPLVICLLYTSPSPRDGLLSRMPSSA